MRAHILENNVIIGTVIVNSLNDLPNLIDGENSAGIGDIYDPQTGTFTAPSPAVKVPQQLTRLQAKAVLMQMGYLEAVQTIMDTADPLYKLAWNEALTFERDSATLQWAASALNLSDAQLDAMFIAGAQIKP